MSRTGLGAGLDFAFAALGADEVVAFTEVHDRPTRAVMTRLGMADTGLTHRPGPIEGRAGVHPLCALYRSRRNEDGHPPATAS